MKKLKELLKRALAYAYSQGVRDFYCGGAIGFDTLVAQEIVLLRMTKRDIKLHLILPCKNQSERWSSEEKNMYDYLSGEADTVEVLFDSYVNGCMQARNRRLVDCCDMLIGFVGKSSGGSYQTYKLALKKNKKVFNLYPSLVKELQENS